MRFIIIIFLLLCYQLNAQNNTVQYWHDKPRSLHYKPEGKDFVCVDATRRFNRALYGTNTGFRVEAGDLPEFALYMPGMGGNFKMGIANGNESKWLIHAKNIKAIYRPGCMLYEISDPLLGNGTLHITVLALANAEGMIIKMHGTDIDEQTSLIWAFGGATGKKFFRDGDIGADPESSFYLQPEYCKDNAYQLKKNSFQLSYGSGKMLSENERYEIQLKPVTGSQKNALKYLTGIVPLNSVIHIADANKQETPLTLFQSDSSALPVITGKLSGLNTDNHFLIETGATVHRTYNQLPQLFATAESARKKLAERIALNTPDAYLNTIGGALSIAADAIWEEPTYLHGSIAWRMRLPAWRGPYAADPLGWHDRAEKHFGSYALSQLTTPATEPVVADTALHLARQLEQLGTSMFSDGYICRNPNGDFRPHHYDMNLVFIDALLNHFNYTGNIDLVQKMWPLIQRHLAWEKRNFDTDGDGLYDAYAAIWASDALQYSGGGVTHTSAYNYRANTAAAYIAALMGEDAAPYQKEATHILNAMQTKLWMPGKGWYAEYKDLLGNRLLHPFAGLWTIYQAIDNKVPDAFQAYECLKYVDNYIPRIPVKAKGLDDENMYLLSTTNWQPYTWSLNNVALAENLNTALAYWQGNLPGTAFNLWRSTLIESMYLGASPGNFQQLSFYDAARGELYRDFADGIGVAARTLVEGLFGIQPIALKDTLLIKPGLPAQWNYASLSIPDISIDFKRKDDTDHYTIIPAFPKKMHLQFIVAVRKDAIPSITINGKDAKWKQGENSVGFPFIQIEAPYAAKYEINIAWKGEAFEPASLKDSFQLHEALQLQFANAKILQVFDPQQALTQIKTDNNIVQALVNATGNKTFFVQVQQRGFSYWQPYSINIKSNTTVVANAPAITASTIFDTISLQTYFNARVTDIFKQQYLSPRATSPTLQLPTQGIGNWCYPLTQAVINDEGLRKMKGDKNIITTPAGVPFSANNDSTFNNILFTSQWDNYPKQIRLPLNGTASHIHLLMAGSTNPMQSRLINGRVIVHYTDNTADTLQLSNPQNWWPIEQDYIIDDHAFTTGASFPLRLYLKEGKFGHGLKEYTTIKGFSNTAIDGGAATVLDMPLNTSKKLQALTLETVANDVVIGLMSVTLQRN